MTRINLLPWRELRRRERDRQFFSISIGAWVLMGLAVFYGHLHVSGLVEHQNKRNQYLKGEIAKVNKEIRQIQNIRRRREALIARMEVIQQLQRTRTQIVHVFDDLVRKIPKGVYFTGLGKKGQRMTLTGFAQSNARVSALMRNLNSSAWFKNSYLNVINVTPKGGARISKFTLQVSEEAPKKKPVQKPAKQAAKPKTTGRG
ncbi:PilN domain-containing protein [Pseudomonadota bacterium]